MANTLISNEDGDLVSVDVEVTVDKGKHWVVTTLTTGDRPVINVYTIKEAIALGRLLSTIPLPKLR